MSPRGAGKTVFVCPYNKNNIENVNTVVGVEEIVNRVIANYYNDH
jgi:hypothetical protein